MLSRLNLTDTVSILVTSFVCYICTFVTMLLLVPPSRRLCFFYLCLSVCLLRRITQKLLIKSVEIYGMVGPGTSQLDFDDLNPRSRPVQVCLSVCLSVSMSACLTETDRQT